MDRRVLVERPMRPQLIIVGSILGQDSAQMRLTQYDHMVDALAPDATTQLALQHNQLMAERRILGFKPALRLERRGQYGQNTKEQRDHRAEVR